MKLEYLYALIPVGILIIVMLIAIKKTNQIQARLEQGLSDEQKSRLALTDIVFTPGKNDEWTQDAIVCEMKEKGEVYKLRLLWHNKVIRTSGYDKLQLADAKIGNAEADAHGLKPGDIVKLKIVPGKSCDIVF